MGVLDKVKSKIQATASDHYHNIQQVPFLADSMNPPTVNPPPPSRPLEQSLIRYRKQRGVNLGSWFVLERWITPGPFDNAAAPGQTDLDIAKGRDGKRVLEQHWDSWITDADWKYIKDRGFNSVRLPIGFYHLAAPLPKCLDGTSHSQYRDAFSGAWQRIEKAIETAGEYGLGVLVDLHAAAGGQNRDAHSGSYGSIGLWGNKVNLASTVLALQFLTTRLAPMPHVVGLELLNEPATDNNVQPFYDSTLPQLRKLAGPDFPLIVHDAWDLPRYTDWLSRRGDEFTIVDHHLYRAFADADKQKSGEQHAADLRGAWGASFAQWSQQAHGQLIVDEWASCLAWETLSDLSTAEADRQRRVFTAAELDLFEKNTAGWYWWTLKTTGHSTDWDVADATSAQVLPQSFMRAWKGPPPSGAKEREQQNATNGHVNYWKANNGTPHADIYSAGFSRGWDDALLFLNAQGGRQQLGYIYQWQLRRRQQYEKSRGSTLGGNAWEYEHGFRQGVTVCENTCLQ